MKKIICSILFLILIIGCNSKKEINENTAQLSDSLSLYLNKVKDTSLLRETRLIFNQKALTLLSGHEQDPLYIKNLFKVADQYYDLSDLQAYKATIQFIEQKTDPAKDSAYTAKVHTYLGNYYRRQSVVDSVYLCYLKAEQIYIQLKDKENIGETELNKAYLFYSQGDYLRAQIAAFEALTYFQDTENNHRERYRIYNLIGALFYELKEYEESITYYNKALNLAKEELQLFKASSLNNLGVVYQSQDKNKEAIAYFEQALQEKGVFKNRPALYAMLQDNLAYSQLKLKEYKELPGLFYKALSIRDSLHIIRGIVVNTLHLSEYYWDQKNIPQAIRFAEEAYTVAKEKGIDPRDILLSLKQLKVIDLSKAVAYAAEYNIISDSLRRIEPVLPDKMIYAAYDAKELALQKAGLEKRNKYRIIGFSCIVFSMIVLFLVYYRKAKNKELQLKEKERIANEKIYDLMLSQEKNMKEEVQKEKKRIARELEEDVFDLLFGVRYELDDLNTRLDMEDTAEDRFFCLYELQKAERNLKLISKDLVDKKESDNNFIAIIKTLAEKQPEKQPVSFYISETLRWEKINNFIKINLYLILEACFRNINDCIQAKNTDIKIVLKKGTIVHMTIVDNAGDFGVEKRLKSPVVLEMLSRVEKMGGTFSITDSGSGIKTEIIVDTHNNYNIISRKNIV